MSELVLSIVVAAIAIAVSRAVIASAKERREEEANKALDAANKAAEEPNKALDAANKAASEALVSALKKRLICSGTDCDQHCTCKLSKSPDADRSVFRRKNRIAPASEYPNQQSVFRACCRGVEAMVISESFSYRRSPGSRSRFGSRDMACVIFCPACGRAKWLYGPRMWLVDDLIVDGSVISFAYAYGFPASSIVPKGPIIPAGPYR